MNLGKVALQIALDLILGCIVFFIMIGVLGVIYEDDLPIIGFFLAIISIVFLFYAFKAQTQADSYQSEVERLNIELQECSD